MSLKPYRRPRLVSEGCRLCNTAPGFYCRNRVGTPKAPCMIVAYGTPRLKVWCQETFDAEVLPKEDDS